MSRSTTPNPIRKIAAATLAVAVAVTGATAIALAPSAGAASGDISGVSYVNFDPNAYKCEETSLPMCLPDHGIGKSNTIYVHQSLVDGEYEFTHLSGTAIDTDDVWMQTTFSAQCRANYRLESAYMVHGGTTDASTALQTEALGDGSHKWPQPVDTGNRTIPNRNVALHQDAEEFAEAQWGVEEVLQWGEQRVEERVDAGHDEDHARTLGYVTDQVAIISAKVYCKKVWHWRTDWRRTASGHPVEIVYLPVGAEPGDEQPNWRDAVIPPPFERPDTGPETLTEGFQVDQVTLSALEDESDACLLHLSGTISTNGPGEVSYRFVDELGNKSQVFDVEVDHTQVAMLDHHIELDPVFVGTGLHATGGRPGQLTTPGTGEIGGIVQEQGDNVQGYYFIEVFSPHMKESNIASYNVDGCTTGGDPSVPTTRGR